MIGYLDASLDRITMYRLVLYYLAALLGAAFLLGLFGMVPHDPAAIAFSAVIIFASCYVANLVFTRTFRVPPNSESIYITALILVLILDPVASTDLRGIGILVFASVWAIASKFIFAIGKKHIFNPAAIGVLLPALLLDAPATWWVAGNLPLLPLTLLGGILLIRKLRRFDLVITFILVDLATVLATTNPSDYSMALLQTLQSSPLFFFAFVMLTEPLTAPTMKVPRLLFTALVGVLFAPNIHVGSFYFTPEIALLIGNIFAYAISPKGRFALTLERIEKSASNTYDFIFQRPETLAFAPGQYLEWTLAVPHGDNRGNRRYFTIASGPDEEDLRLGVKFNVASSAFKRALGGMRLGDTIYAAQLAGSFTLPKDPSKKLAFLAGGVGITPFRSMLADLLTRSERRPVEVLYANALQADIAYRDVLDQAEQQLGIQTRYVVATDPGPGQYPGLISAALVRATIPDFAERTFYLSGPQAMVSALRKMLRGMGVKGRHIKVDFFPGLA